MKIRNSLILLLTAAIWGVAFVAQSVGMDYVGPFTFLFARSVIGGIVLLPVVAILHRNGAIHTYENAEEKRRARKTLILGGVCCGTVLCFASIFQQIGLLYTTVGKSGFLTACYILIVPLLGLLFRRKCGRLVWCGVALAIVGLYFLCLTDGLSVNLGDLLTFICAILFSVHIMVIDHFSPLTDSVKMSCIQFYVCAAIAGVGMLLFEQPSLSALLAAWKPVLYAGALSSGAAYTLQIIGQKGMNPTVASLIMSLESVISVLAGWVILHQTLSGREILGCVLMFAAIILAQLPDKSAA
ncbi:DMT family transporter [Candidatus Agathobaculum pullicola]|uniref:DMT family transporter n=1 Tax=Candidatus Agathobaculum pullicola TaxID=2838426 RepID=UPI003F8EC118